MMRQGENTKKIKETRRKMWIFESTWEMKRDKEKKEEIRRQDERRDEKMMGDGMKWVESG